MKQRKGILIITALGATIALLTFWPITIIFLALGCIVALAIFMIGYNVNFLLVVLIEFLLVVVFVAIVMSVIEKKRPIIM